LPSLASLPSPHSPGSASGSSSRTAGRWPSIGIDPRAPPPGCLFRIGGLHPLEPGVVDRAGRHGDRRPPLATSRTSRRGSWSSQSSWRRRVRHDQRLTSLTTAPGSVPSAPPSQMMRRALGDPGGRLSHSIRRYILRRHERVHRPSGKEKAESHSVAPLGLTSVSSCSRPLLRLVPGTGP